MKARFNITLIHPNNLTALSNMLPKGEQARLGVTQPWGAGGSPRLGCGAGERGHVAHTPECSTPRRECPI